MPFDFTSKFTPEGVAELLSSPLPQNVKFDTVTAWAKACCAPKSERAEPVEAAAEETTESKPRRSGKKKD
jgi:hypothetical protein